MPNTTIGEILPVPQPRERIWVSSYVDYGSFATDFIVPTSGMQQWLKADDGITKDGANLISAWNDQSGNNNHATQGISSSQPIFNSSGPNGRPTVSFDGVNNFSAFGSNSLIGSSGFTLFSALKLSEALTDSALPIRVKTASEEVILGLGTNGNSGFGGRSPYFGYRGSAAMTTSPPIYSDSFTLESIIMASHDGGDKNSALTYNFSKNGTASTLTALPAIGGTGYANEIGRDDNGTKYFKWKNLGDYPLQPPSQPR